MKIDRRGFFASLFTPLLSRLPQSKGTDLGRPADRYPTYAWAKKVLALRLYRQRYVSKESLVNILEARIANAKSEMDARLAQDFETLGAGAASNREGESDG